MQILTKLKFYIFIDNDLSVYICILNTLIELIQGPCTENQDNLTRLDFLSDLLSIIKSLELIKDDKLNLEFLPFTSRISILLLSLI